MNFAKVLRTRFLWNTPAGATASLWEILLPQFSKFATTYGKWKTSDQIKKNALKNYLKTDMFTITRKISN